MSRPALSAYHEVVRLDAPFVAPPPLLHGDRGRVLRTLVDHLVADGTAERLDADLSGLGDDPERLREALRALLTVRDPPPLPEAFHADLDALLQAEKAIDADGVALPRLRTTHPGRAYPVADRTALWRGDITRLNVDAIVNAANAQMLGCFVPYHACIDNAIHNAAGPRLREDCARIMELQGHDEKTGVAKVTRAYNLPSRYVLHTVGPIVRGPLLAEHEALLASSYRACFDTAAEVGARSVAFCSISTGVFSYPKEPAARTALATVADWLAGSPAALDLVVFNVFSAADRAVYDEAIASWR